VPRNAFNRYEAGLGPAGLYHFVGAACREDQKAEHRSRNAACYGEVSHELRCFGVGQRRMMPHDAFRPLWKLLAQLFGELGRISKIGVVNIDVLCDETSNVQIMLR
jgi:hypothetical protein